jgi:carbamoyl-phosphate synthase large subunit
VFFSLADRDKPVGLEAARRFVDLGFTIAATSGTSKYLRDHGVPVATEVAKVGEVAEKVTQAPETTEVANTAESAEAAGTTEAADAVELISSGLVQLVVNSPRGRGPRADGAHIRRAASVHSIPCLTTAAAARAAAAGIADWAAHPLTATCLQEYHQGDQQQFPLE